MQTVALVSTFGLASILVAAARAQETYKLPSKDVVDILDAAPSPSVRPSPDAKTLLLVDRPAMPSIADVARPWVGLAGLRIDPATNGLQQPSFDAGLVLHDVASGAEHRVALAKDARIGSIDWSQTSKQFAFTLVGADGIDLWVCTVDGARAQRVAQHVNAIFGGFQWMPDGTHLLAMLVPDDRGAAPQAPSVPIGPTTMESSGHKSPTRTYPDLLRDEHDSALFAYLISTQLAIVDATNASNTHVGKSGTYVDAEPSPDGKHLLVERLHKPFSYVFGLDRFSRAFEVWSTAGQLEKVIVDAPLQDQIPIEGVETGPRDIAWRPGELATLVWCEALDGGDPRQKAEQRDRWMAQAAPFDAAPKELLRLQYRARGLTWFADPSLVLASEYDRDRRWLRSTLDDLSGLRKPLVLEEHSINERYAHPGQIQTEQQADGTRVAKQAGEWIFRAGEGDSAAGSFPFLDRQSINSRAAERLWRCDANYYENVVTIASVAANGKPTILTRRESPTEPPNIYVRNLESTNLVQVTHFADPQPQIRGISKELVTYQRDDGLQLSAMLYLPANYKPGTKLPLVVWAYPLEYNDASTAGQVSGSNFRFLQITGLSQLIFATQGYAVMDDAKMPIIGDPETMNDKFLPQIEASARACIQKAAALGVADPERAGVGGHSYGAFMTANLLANTDLFRAGIARSGAYNRTLTPFGFQSERRTFWEAPQAYDAVSPFMHADKINEPLLMIHGEKDANPGTFPIQSERLYQAIAGLGGTVRLVLLPEESHGYRARESVLDTAAEMIEWFDKYVKGANPHEASAPRAGR
jgi:dipeptidyl aminopeptidase/acylaminoacyl peptidase